MLSFSTYNSFMTVVYRLGVLHSKLVNDKMPAF